MKSGIKKGNGKKFRIGIIVNEGNAEDILFYNEQLKSINDTFGGGVSLIIFGYKPEEDTLNMLDSVSFEYIKPVSIIHYFKQLKSTGIDLLFVPLINNTYNATSENYNKYMEMALFKVPIITVDIYPYNQLIQDKINGFIYPSREVFIEYLTELLKDDISVIKQAGLNAHNRVIRSMNFSKENVATIESVITQEPTKSQPNE